MGVLVLIFLGWIVSQSGRPLLFAGIWALFVLFTGLVLDEAGLAAALMSAVVGFVFAAVYFWLLDRFADQILIWIAILIGLPALMVVARLQLLASTGSG
ncbi:hypothetical protein SSPSH_001125 [Salinisphaera shabanensis E1L3A]|jgi:hypothetical protein|uniref:Uncharacterized protein n=1 Tax=Salinisphaera shabanensis E1L3A TaxID=1033802 RepID=U2EQ91_9GAMM|nr:hypothetical protein [Salinisphaera shabanensis]ERJ19950.1 hypothetical protein SSPSH_001125 [Salinisphaera shabanensis E1L3A]|tara:strand:- start:229 stop:525 length:297 start_codon:yes stop_codon:yes gene_type:complete